MNKIFLTAAVLIAATGFAFADDVGIGAHIGPDGVGAHIGPLHGGVGVVPEREHRHWHRGTYSPRAPGRDRGRRSVLA